MINFYDGEITDIMPGNLTRDTAVQAVSYALKKGTQLLYQYLQLCHVYCSIETMPDKILDLMAQELRTQYYKDSLDIETKRALVRNTLIWYMTAGTPAAVEELITVVFGEGRVVEWFEYGAKPYWFKVQTDALLTEDKVAYFPRMLWKVKNTRSHIHMIEVHRSVELNIYAGSNQNLIFKPAAIIDGYVAERDTRSIIYTGSAQSGYMKQAPVIDGYTAERTITNTIYAATTQTGHIRQAPIVDGFATSNSIENISYVGIMQAKCVRQIPVKEEN